jgi:folylpolyglutamate synthase
VLSVYGERTGFPQKTGLYSSPHLISYEERIRINQRPITRELFAKYFFEVWECLLEKQDGDKPLPRYLQLLCLVAFHAFIREGVEAAIFETHHGGEYDATNVIGNPVATVITPLGKDHVQQLGPGIENIAWHKSGIFKSGARAFSALQEPVPAEVLKNRAAEKDVEIRFVGDDPSLPDEAPKLKPNIQRLNCSLALAAARYVVDKAAPQELGPILSSDVERGIDRFTWPGRFQVLSQPGCRWFLDGAHNEMSVAVAAEWFIDLTEKYAWPRTMLQLVF